MSKNLKVLVIDQDHANSHLIKSILEDMADITCAVSQDQVRNQLENNKFDIVILDPSFEGHQGYQLISELRSDSLINDSKLFVVSAIHSKQTEIESHKYDIDEFIRKPVDSEILRVIVEKHAKRLTNLTSTELHFGDLVIDLGSLMVSLDQGEEKKDVSLTSKEFKILVSLVQNAGEVLTREDLYSNIWNKQSNHVQRTLDMHVSSLRKKLGETGQYIKTIRSAGYKIELAS